MICTRCQQEKPTTHYIPNQRKCKACRSELSKIYYQKNKIKMRAQHQAWRDGNPLRFAYLAQKTCAKQRDIQWEFTFESWLEWWGDDIELRGSKPDDLCCCRYGDEGPYSPDNCYKDTFHNNSIDGGRKGGLTKSA